MTETVSARRSTCALLSFPFFRLYGMDSVTVVLLGRLKPETPGLSLRVVQDVAPEKDTWDTNVRNVPSLIVRARSFGEPPTTNAAHRWSKAAAE